MILTRFDSEVITQYHPSSLCLGESSTKMAALTSDLVTFVYLSTEFAVSS